MTDVDNNSLQLVGLILRVGSWQPIGAVLYVHQIGVAAEALEGILIGNRRY